jgi:hypothetical protein
MKKSIKSITTILALLAHTQGNALMTQLDDELSDHSGSQRSSTTSDGGIYDDPYDLIRPQQERREGVFDIYRWRVQQSTTNQKQLRPSFFLGYREIVRHGSSFQAGDSWNRVQYNFLKYPSAAFSIEISSSVCPEPTEGKTCSLDIVVTQLRKRKYYQDTCPDAYGKPEYNVEDVLHVYDNKGKVRIQADNSNVALNECWCTIRGTIGQTEYWTVIKKMDRELRTNEIRALDVGFDLRQERYRNQLDLCLDKLTFPHN